MATSPREILGLKENSTQAQIKTRYRTLVKRYHPDVNEGDATAEWVFKQINQAYRTLSEKDDNGPPPPRERAHQPAGEAHNGAGRARRETRSSSYKRGKSSWRKEWKAAHSATEQWKQYERRERHTKRALAGIAAMTMAYGASGTNGWSILVAGLLGACVCAILWRIAMGPYDNG